MSTQIAVLRLLLVSDCVLLFHKRVLHTELLLSVLKSMQSLFEMMLHYE